MFGKDINTAQHTVTTLCGVGLPSTLLDFADVWFISPRCWFVCCDFIQSNSSKSFSWYSSGFLPLLQTPAGWWAEPCSVFWIELLLLIHVWCLPSRLDCSCWFVCGGFAIRLNCWYPNNGDWNHSKELFLQDHFCWVLITFLFHYLWWVVG